MKKIGITILIAVCLIAGLYFVITGINKDGERINPDNNTVQQYAEVSPAAEDSENSTVLSSIVTHNGNNQEPTEELSSETGEATDSAEKSEASNIIKPSTGNLPGNNMSSLSDAGTVATDGEWDYAVLRENAWMDGGLYKISIDGTRCIQLTDYDVHYINLVEDWIYYIIYKESIYRIKKDGSQNEQIFEGECRNMVIIGETIYFENCSDKFKLYSMDTNGNNVNKFIDMAVSMLQYEDEYLYYTSYDKTRNVYRVNTTDNGKIEKIEENISKYIVYKNSIYYTKKDESKLYRKNIGESESTVIKNEVHTSYFIENDKIYFTTGESDDEDICTMDLDGTNVAVYFRGERMKPVRCIHGMIRNTVYYWITSGIYGTGDDVLARINEDGSTSTVREIIRYCDKAWKMNLIKPSTGNLPGNSMSSLAKAWGRFATDGEWDYAVLREFVYTGAGLYKISIDGTKCVQLTDHSLCYINLVEDWIYYSNKKNGIKGIYRMKKDGSLSEKIFDDFADDMVIVGETVYFVNGSDKNKIYSMDTNGGGIKKISDMDSLGLQYEDGYLYFTSKTQTTDLYRINTLNIDEIETLVENTYYFIVYDNAIYYQKKDESILYKKNIGESESTVINNDVDSRYFIENDKIYFTTGSSEDENIYTMDLDGKNVSVFFNGGEANPVNSIFGVVRNTVYYWITRNVNSPADDELARINEDGSINMGSEIISGCDK